MFNVKNIARFLQTVFPYAFVLYISMLLVEGLTWRGVFYKHLYIYPTYFLVLSIISGIPTLISLKSMEKATYGYTKIVLMISRVTPWFFLSYITALLLQPFVSDWLIRKGIMRWDLFKSTLGNILILLIIFLVLFNRTKIPILRKKNNKYYLSIYGEKAIRFHPILFRITLFFLFFIIFIFQFDIFRPIPILVAILSSLLMVLLNDLLLDDIHN